MYKEFCFNFFFGILLLFPLFVSVLCHLKFGKMVGMKHIYAKGCCSFVFCGSQYVFCFLDFCHNRFGGLGDSQVRFLKYLPNGIELIRDVWIESRLLFVCAFDSKFQ